MVALISLDVIHPYLLYLGTKMGTGGFGNNWTHFYSSLSRRLIDFQTLLILLTYLLTIPINFSTNFVFFPTYILLPFGGKWECHTSTPFPFDTLLLRFSGCLPTKSHCSAGYIARLVRPYRPYA